MANKILKTKKGQEILVDEDIYNEFKNRYIYIDDGYAFFNKRKKDVSLARYILNAPANKQVDHINRNKLDNRRCNLRLVTCQQNALNKGKNLNIVTSSKYKGVSFKKSRNKWRARISFNCRSYELGFFASEKEAALSYNKACEYYHKEFAVLNIVTD